MPPRYAALGVIALTLALAYGTWYSYSVFLVALAKEFGWSRSVLAGAFSVFTLVHGLVNPLVGELCARLRALRVMAAGGVVMALALLADSFVASPSGLYLGFGVATALGVATAGWVPALVHVHREYPDRVGLAIGIVSSGIGVGMLLVVPATQWLIEAIGWRGAFRALALASLLWIVPASMWMLARGRGAEGQTRGQTPMKSGTVPEPRRGEIQGQSPISLAQAMRGEPFWLLVAAFFFGNVCSQMLHVHQVAYLVEHGVAAMVAASVVGVVGLASIAGKTGGGWLSDRVERELVYVGGVAIMVVSALVLLALGAAPSAWAAYAYAVLLGVGYSATAAINPAMMSDRFAGPHFGAIVGVGLMGSSAGSALGPWLAGYLYDAAGSYTIAFLIAAASGAVAAGCGWRARVLRRR